jgi:hypothetical protein
MGPSMYRQRVVGAAPVVCSNRSTRSGLARTYR